MGYQSFPWARGDSGSSKKLLALQLPSLEGKTFLDVGCNEGFFCGHAEFLGAKSVTGVDAPLPGHGAQALPGVRLSLRGLGTLGEERYDVILNASAIHYAKDQKKFLDMLMGRLNPGGVLVPEIGVAPGKDNAFVEVRRAIDTRLFPTRAKLTEMLDGYAWKLVSRSVPQAGAPPGDIPHYAQTALRHPRHGRSPFRQELHHPGNFQAGDQTHLGRCALLRGGGRNPRGPCLHHRNRDAKQGAWIAAPSPTRYSKKGLLRIFADGSPKRPGKRTLSSTCTAPAGTPEACRIS